MILKKGIHRDILNNEQLEFNKILIRRFIKLYTEKKEYRELHIEDAVRYDLEGNKVGKVTLEEVENIKKMEEDIKKSREEKNIRQMKGVINLLPEANKRQYTKDKFNRNKDQYNKKSRIRPRATVENIGNIKEVGNNKSKLRLNFIKKIFNKSV